MGFFSKAKPADRCIEFTARVRAQIDAHRKEDQRLDAEQRKIATARDKAKGECLASARAEAEGTIASLVAQACDRLQQTAEALDKQGAEPTEPSLDVVRADSLDAYLEAQAKFAVALPAHRESVRLIARGLVNSLKGLDHEAQTVKGECRKIGLESLGGIGLIAEWVLQRQGCRDITIGAGSEPRQWLRHITNLAAAGELTAEHCRLLGNVLQMPEPENQAPNPTYLSGWRRRESTAPTPTAQAWRSVEQALAEPAPVAQTQTQKDADKYTAAVAAGTLRPIGERALDIPGAK